MGEVAPGIGLAPSWAIWAGSAGRLLVLAGLILFLATIALSALHRQRAAAVGFVLASLSLFGAFAVLATLFATKQFEYEYVFSHADKLTPLQYKIAGVWSGQEGSFLLWACSSALFGLWSFRRTGDYRRWYLITYAAFLGSLCGILAYETPFQLLEGARQARGVLVPEDGRGLAPSLQNYWVVIHPPTIFLGFGSLTVPFCWAMSAMLTRNPVDWAHRVRPWALLSVAILGLGICMGGFWAYETLGWGGFWAWDPVENASFVPWLLAVAFVHGLIVQAAKGKWHSSNLLLGGLPFLAFLYGTFLTRSGFLSEASVHSFAQMDRNALWILLGLLLLGFSSFLILWLARGVLGRPAPEETNAPLTRESVYRLGVTLISLFALTVAIGMSVPFFMGVLGRPAKVVQEGLYHMVVVWFFVPIMLLIALAPFVGWKRGGGIQFRNRVFGVFSIAFGFTGLLTLLFTSRRFGVQPDPLATVGLPFNRQNPNLPHEMPLLPWMVFLTFLCVFAIVANLWRIGELSRRAKAFSFGGFIAHIGLATLMAGLLLSRGFERKEQVITQRGSPAIALRDYVLVPGNWSGRDAGDRDAKLSVDVQGPNGLRYTAKPGLYWIGDEDGNPQSMRWPSIRSTLSHDLYLALGDPVTKVWPQGLTLKPGETVRNEFVSVTYHRMKRLGDPGQPGTEFIADLTVADSRGKYEIRPSIRLTEDGPDHPLERAGPNFLVALTEMQPSGGPVKVDVYFSTPWYPMELYYKPLTLLVWVGAGILTLGGFISALYRRRNYDAAAELTLEPVPTATE